MSFIIHSLTKSPALTIGQDRYFNQFISKNNRTSSTFIQFERVSLQQTIKIIMNVDELLNYQVRIRGIFLTLFSLFLSSRKNLRFQLQVLQQINAQLMVEQEQWLDFLNVLNDPYLMMCPCLPVVQRWITPILHRWVWVNVINFYKCSNKKHR